MQMFLRFAKNYFSICEDENEIELLLIAMVYIEKSNK
jgi:hypothetical protein